MVKRIHNGPHGPIFNKIIAMKFLILAGEKSKNICPKA
jgi:hypothetical protein